MKAAAEMISLRFTISVLQDELKDRDAHFDRLDRLYSEFIFQQNSHAGFLHRIGEITKEERDCQWDEVDAQESEWEARLCDWREKRFCLNEALSQLQARLRELTRREEVLNVAA